MKSLAKASCISTALQFIKYIGTSITIVEAY
jgi:hypothetical protein